MCLIRSAIGLFRSSLVVAANRDEVHERASQPHVLGRHRPSRRKRLVAGASRAAIERVGLAPLIQEKAPVTPKSRGALVHDFLSSELTAMDYVNKIIGAEYAGYNLLLWDRQSWFIPQQLRRSSSGEYGLSNELGAPGPAPTQKILPA